jgi:enoyl-CoA hydratase/3-hydroxyacyl-CoA dehydrogenase
MTFVAKAAVVGAGTMGAEIAQAIAAADLPVVLVDVADERVQAGLRRVREVTDAQLAAQMARGRLTEEQAQAQSQALIGRVTGSTGYADLYDVDLVVEAVPERMELKQEVLAELDACTPGHAVLASNTSSLSITEMAEATLRPDRVVGLHFFYPASTARLVEVVGGDETSDETIQAAIVFAGAIRKTAITCAEVPGFVVNRVLLAAAGEVWRAQAETGLAPEVLDRLLTDAKVVPVGPFRLADVLGVDTVLHVAEYLQASYGERFVVHEPMRELVRAGRLGRKTGRGSFDYSPDGAAPAESPAQPPDGELADALADLPDRVAYRALLEACLLVEEGVAGVREIDLGLTLGAGLAPPPFARADELGLDEALARLEALEARHGERFAPPTILRRLVAQRRLGRSSGQGFFPAPRLDAEPAPAADAAVGLETRGAVAIAWLDRAPANSLSPAVIAQLDELFARVEDDPAVRVLVIASALPQIFCAGADIKAFTKMDAAAGRELLDAAHGLLRRFEHSSTITIAAVNALALGGGCELAMGCDLRIAARSASFGQPEIALGIMPGFGGTQRLPRLVGVAKALEMNLGGDPISADEAFALGLVNAVVDDHELLDEALAWARRLATRAPIAVAEIKRASARGDLDEGIAAEKEGFARAFASEDGREGISAFLAKRSPRFRGR